MNLLHFSLLAAGGLFMAVPVLLHLLLKQQPKQLVFPALRFVKQRKETNTRKMHLRHWLLLLLRCLAVLLIGAALARPSVGSTQFGNWLLAALVGALALVAVLLTVASAVQRRGWGLLATFGGMAAALGIVFIVLTVSAQQGRAGPKLGERSAPAAAALVIDTAPHMLYRHENRTRLEAAQESAAWVLKQLPEESEIAVLDARPAVAAFALDRAAATQAVAQLQPAGAPLPLAAVVREALELVKQSDKTLKDIFVFTDLAASAWDEAAAGNLADELKQATGVGLVIVDVGVEKPQDFALGELTLSADMLAQSGQLELGFDVRRLGPAADRTVEVTLEEPSTTGPIIVDGKPEVPALQVRQRQTLHLEDGAAQGLAVQLVKLPPGVHHGQVRLVGEDALAANDMRYFTVSVQPAWRVLVVASPGVSSTAWVEAIAPFEFRQTGQAKFDCVTITTSELANQDLASFAAVFLLDPGPLAPPDWEKLAEFVQAGGGLGVFLGHLAEPSAFNAKEAQQLLPAKLGPVVRIPEGTWLDPRSLDHPVLAPFRAIGTSVPWRAFPVYRYWSLKEPAADAQVVIPFADGRAALLERQVGGGRVMLLATPVSDPLRPAGRPSWNELPTGENAWPYFILANELAAHVISQRTSRLNYLAGDTAVLVNDPERDPERFQLFAPQDDPYEVAARDGRVTIKFTDRPGAYRLKGERDGVVLRGFSVNLAPSATELVRVEKSQLDKLLGAERYQQVKTQEEIVFGATERAGREFYPLLMLALVLILAGEHVLANRFYREREPAQAAPRSREVMSAG